MTQLALAKALGLSLTTVKNLMAKGMPVQSVEAAREWRAQNVRPQNNGQTAQVHPVKMPLAKGETLEATLARLRRLEAGLSRALGKAFHNGQVQEATALRREYIQSLTALSAAEVKLDKILKDRLEVIHLSRALALVNGSLEGGLRALRHLPELARDDAERARLEAFLVAVLEEFKRGAAEAAAPLRS